MYRRSLFRPLSQEVALRRKAVRKDLAVHVSLSSDSLVKQPGNHRGTPPPHLEGVAEAQVIWVDMRVRKEGGTSSNVVISRFKVQVQLESLILAQSERWRQA